MIKVVLTRNLEINVAISSLKPLGGDKKQKLA
jgi:hypothetical protein